MIKTQFSLPLLRWFDNEGRKNLPWQHPRSDYRVWISEIMLQQTQVKTVIPYFERFMTRFPDVWQLAHADEENVLALWSGLGYYSRARNLCKTARIVCEKYQGIFPVQLTALIELPGIGPSTAAAIAAQAFNQPTPILDGNVKRVLCRYFQVDGLPEQSAVKRKLWQLATECMPKERCADYTQAIMDFGAICCKLRNPLCDRCPVQTTCRAKLNDKVMLYPFKKIKKTLPLKKQQLLLLYDYNNKIYLEKRPPTGIWGSLWSLPGIDFDDCPSTFIANAYGLTSEKNQDLLTMRHTFSHFHLDIKAVTLLTSPTSTKIAENAGKWFDSSEINDLGLARPIRRIIYRFWETR